MTLNEYVYFDVNLGKDFSNFIQCTSSPVIIDSSLSWFVFYFNGGSDLVWYIVSKIQRVA